MAIVIQDRTYFDQKRCIAGGKNVVAVKRVDSAGTGRVFYHNRRYLCTASASNRLEQWMYFKNAGLSLVEGTAAGGSTKRGVATDSRFIYTDTGGSFERYDDARNANLMETITISSGANFGLSFNSRFFATVNRSSTQWRQIDIQSGQIVDSFTIGNTASDTTENSGHLYIYRNEQTGLGTRNLDEYKYSGELLDNYAVEPTTNSGGADSITHDSMHPHTSYRRVE